MDATWEASAGKAVDNQLRGAASLCRTGLKLRRPGLKEVWHTEDCGFCQSLLQKLPRILELLLPRQASGRAATRVVAGLLQIMMLKRGSRVRRELGSECIVFAKQIQQARNVCRGQRRLQRCRADDQFFLYGWTPTFKHAACIRVARNDAPRSTRLLCRSVAFTLL